MSEASLTDAGSARAGCAYDYIDGLIPETIAKKNRRFQIQHIQNAQTMRRGKDRGDTHQLYLVQRVVFGKRSGSCSRIEDVIEVPSDPSYEKTKLEVGRAARAVP
jgi:hypothetical protein